MSKARWALSAVHADLVAIIDLHDNREAMPSLTVTNDIEAVVADLVALGYINRERHVLIYRDSQRDWDQALIDPVSLTFRDFAPIRTKSLVHALRKVRQS